jgi:acetyl-CoA C-acetyltransferase
MSSHINENLDDVVILSAVRTPIGSFNGCLSALKAHQLGAVAIKGALSKVSGTISLEEVSEVIMGQVLTANEGQNPARQAARGGGLSYSIPATTVNMVCGSGLKAVILGAQAIKTGDSVIVVAGGQESMSQAPHCVPMRQGKKMGDATLVDTMLHDGLTDAFNHVHMGNTAETVAQTCLISRDEQDEFALQSQLKCAHAMSLGHFDAEIEPIVISTSKSDVQIKQDEYPRQGVTMELLSKLKTVFKDAGTVTAGNASGLNDGAAAVVLCSNRTAKLKQQVPLAKIVSWAQSGVDPLLMGLAPIKAIRDALQKANWTIESVDLFELNEAFASQSVAVIRELRINPEKINVNGGAIALGHPLGASGARVLVTLIHALKRTGLKRGVAALCIGGGMGIAICIETF